MKILILGGTGMLGNAVGHYFSNTKHDITLTYRNKNVIYGSERHWLHFDVLDKTQDLSNLITRFDYVINCIGIIKPFMSENPIASRLINSVFPWQLSQSCNAQETKLIHITTDCVFSGKEGKYLENALHDASDDYGKSKSLGEPIKEGMIIRTSIIGEEIHKHASFIAWAKSQKGKIVKGFTNHTWNGITTKQYAKICEKIINNNWYQKGLFHVHSNDDVNKYKMLQYLNNKYDLNLTIKSFETEHKIDRTLRSYQPLCKKIMVPSVIEMIDAI